MKNYKKILKILQDYPKQEICEKITSNEVFQIAGYKNPIYISILGHVHKNYEINIYMNDEQLYRQYDIVYGEYQNYPDYFFRLSCYKIVFSNIDDLLGTEDRNRLKKNRMKTKPAIFHLIPGKRPAIITEEEAELLIPIVENIIQVTQFIILENIEFKESKIEQQYKFTINQDKITYKIGKFPLGHTITAESVPIDNELLNKVLIFSQKGTFGMSLFYGPLYDSTNQRYERVMVLSDIETEQILDIQTISIGKEKELLNYLLASFYKIKRYPNNIAFGSTKELLRCQNLIPELQMNYKIDTEMKHHFNQWEELAKYISSQTK